ncbi:M28 family metallopeptidase [Mucilaginibacter sp. L3T2-6]|uniref:M28 family metallopeptidase n=1 Tax=Mucilaginibacter sp. L3T2-6 TaxID=3062491 RepID=UPI0026758952|nr:M28 family peptidase [Mucilaginibacter sp. L3T2-6]MDO3642070.1 M28 family peptidase [Mucilaginibacter sp. L3T2-6]MDV6214564.1 M28 family peptidase [Mucilaginibacter sp. L3T2-6]
MKLKLTLFLLLFAHTIFAQDSLYARRIVDTLTSPYFWGRGYTKDGVHKAADYITGQFKTFGLKPLDGKDFMQSFAYNVNTFPGAMKVSINGAELKPGQDFIVSPESRGVKGDGRLIKKDSVTFINPENRIIVLLEDKLTWSVEQQAADYAAIIVRKKALKSGPETVNADIENKLITGFKTGNICAMVRGTVKPDSFLVYTAHYDHLGGMGADTYFPGANDNASGVSQVLSLAKYYAKHPQKYSMAFICFSGEEAGLLGSGYFAEHPLIPLSNIRFLINLDLEGTGEEGITVVNATIHSKEFEMLKTCNANGHYLVKVYSRGKAPNSDHYPFTEKGVPAFYMYTMGGIKAYHDVYDISKTLPLNEYNHLFKLLVDFNGELMK